jgi:hypothetical protein
MGKLVSDRGLMNLAVFGILLQVGHGLAFYARVGLHSSDLWILRVLLIVFIVSQLAYSAWFFAASFWKS